MRKLIRAATFGTVFASTMLLLVHVSRLDNKHGHMERMARSARWAANVPSFSEATADNSTSINRQHVVDVCKYLSMCSIRQKLKLCSFLYIFLN